MSALIRVESLEDNSKVITSYVVIPMIKQISEEVEFITSRIDKKLFMSRGGDDNYILEDLLEWHKHLVGTQIPEDENGFMYARLFVATYTTNDNVSKEVVFATEKQAQDFIKTVIKNIDDFYNKYTDYVSVIR